MLVFAAAPAHAMLDLKSLFEKKQTPVSLSDIYPIQNDEDFEGISKSFHGRPYNDPQIEFEILVPKDWVLEVAPDTHSTLGMSRALIGDLSRFRSPVINTMRATVAVQSIKLDHEISAENWLKSYILSNKYALQGTINATSDKKAGANCIETKLDGSSSYIYITVQVNGNDAVIVRFDSPLVLKDVMAFVRNKIVDSFRFILVTDHPIETLKSFTFGTALKFRYPESLVVNHVDIGDTRFMSAQFYNVIREGMVDKGLGKSIAQIQGLIRFVVVRRNHNTSLKKEANDLRDFVSNILKVDFRKLISSDKAQVSNRFLFSRYEVYEVAPRKNNPIPQELRLVALGDKNWYVLGILFSTSDSENFYAWANNVQDFNMIIKDFR